MSTTTPAPTLDEYRRAVLALEPKAAHIRGGVDERDEVCADNGVIGMGWGEYGAWKAAAETMGIVVEAGKLPLDADGECIVCGGLGDGSEAHVGRCISPLHPWPQEEPVAELEPPPHIDDDTARIDAAWGYDPMNPSGVSNDMRERWGYPTTL